MSRRSRVLQRVSFSVLFALKFVRLCNSATLGQPPVHRVCPFHTPIEFASFIPARLVCAFFDETGFCLTLYPDFRQVRPGPRQDWCRSCSQCRLSNCCSHGCDPGGFVSPCVALRGCVCSSECGGLRYLLVSLYRSSAHSWVRCRFLVTWSIVLLCLGMLSIRSLVCARPFLP